MASLSLHDACRTGAMDDVRRILDAEPDLLNRPQPEDGCAPLHHAAFGGHPGIVDELLRRGATPGTRDRSGYTPLHYAAFAGASDVARRLMDEGVDPDAVDDSRTTALHAAAAGGALDLVDELLDRGLAPDTPNLYGETPLHRAAQRNRLDIVKRLIESGAPIDTADRYSLTPIQKAAIGGAVDVLAWLVEAGASTDVCDLLGDTPLHSAAGMARAEAVRWLLDHGASVDATNAEGATPLHAAAERATADVVSLLLTRGADPNAIDALRRSPLHAAAASGAAAAIEPLVAAGARLNATTIEGRTPLDSASLHGRREACRALVDCGAIGEFDPAAVRTLIDRPAAEDELTIWYLGHSGWAIRTANQFLVIDYAPDGEDGEGASLLNGRVIASELPALPITVLVSHHHADHFSPRILDWADGRDIRYVFGWDASVEAPTHRFTSAGQAIVGDVRTTAIPSTDSGAAFLIEVDGFRIYHAGDHAATGIPPEAAFADGVTDLGKRFAPIDIAFLPVFGCGLPDIEPLRAGTDLTIDRLAPRAIFPMHVGWTGHFYRLEKRRLESLDRSRRVAAASRPGDRYVYRAGRVRTLDP